MENILLDLRTEGKTPMQKEWLDSSVNWSVISLLCSFKIFAEILVESTSFRKLGDWIIFLVSVLSTGLMKNNWCLY